MLSNENIKRRNPVVSICCPCYNSEKFIKKTVESFVNQSAMNIEIIISDDCSDDNTYNIIKSEFNDNRIKLFKQSKNLGPSLNSQFVADKSNSNYLCMCAGDDLMHPERVKKCYEFMEKNPDCTMVYTFVQTISDNDQSYYDPMMAIFNQDKSSRDMLKYFFYEGNFICATSIMIRKKCLDNLSWNPCLLQLQDFDMWIKMLLNGFKIICLPEKLTYYRIHNNNLSGIVKSSSQVINRVNYEHEKILYSFLDKITTKEQVKEIFNIEVPCIDLIPFLIAQEALKVKKESHYNFAINVIYHEMLNEEKRKLIYQYYNFVMKDFYNMIGKKYLVCGFTDFLNVFILKTRDSFRRYKIWKK